MFYFMCISLKDTDVVMLQSKELDLLTGFNYVLDQMIPK